MTLLSRLTELLGRMQTGDAGARDALFAEAYAELHRLARARLPQGARDVVLDTTCLVHESYLRFVSAGELCAEDRRAFLRLCFPSDAFGDGLILAETLR